MHDSHWQPVGPHSDLHRIRAQQTYQGDKSTIIDYVGATTTDIQYTNHWWSEEPHLNLYRIRGQYRSRAAIAGICACHLRHNGHSHRHTVYGRHHWYGHHWQSEKPHADLHHIKGQHCSIVDRDILHMTTIIDIL